MATEDDTTAESALGGIIRLKSAAAFDHLLFSAQSGPVALLRTLFILRWGIWEQRWILV